MLEGWERPFYAYECALADGNNITKKQFDSDGLSKDGWLDMLMELGILEEGDNDIDVFEVGLRYFLYFALD